jgi:hypothetical protein
MTAAPTRADVAPAFRAWPDYGHSREHIVISRSGDSAYLGYVQAWAGSLYWPVHDMTDRVVAYVRRELGGLYGPNAMQAESIKWAANVLLERAALNTRSAT